MTFERLDRSKKYLVTGGAGFIGSHLVDRLVALGCEVTVFDNFRGCRDDLKTLALTRARVRVVEGDVTDAASLTRAMAGCDVVFHFGAHSDTQRSNQIRDIDLKNNTIGTWNVLEAMRETGAARIVFSSSQLVFGPTARVMTESSGPLCPASLFGASKVACEALISAYTHLQGIEGIVCRLANVVGGRMNRGIIADLLGKLGGSQELRLLGDGSQRRSYLWVDDCVDAVLFALVAEAEGKFRIYNVANTDTLSALEIAQIIVSESRRAGDVAIVTEPRSQGWNGDVPQLVLDVSRLRELGWSPKLSSRAAVTEAVRRLLAERR